MTELTELIETLKQTKMTPEEALNAVDCCGGIGLALPGDLALKIANNQCHLDTSWLERPASPEKQIPDINTLEEDHRELYEVIATSYVMGSLHAFNQCSLIAQHGLGRIDVTKLNTAPESPSPAFGGPDDEDPPPRPWSLADGAEINWPDQAEREDTR